MNARRSLRRGKPSKQHSSMPRQGQPQERGRGSKAGQEDKCPCTGKDGDARSGKRRAAPQKPVAQTCEDFRACPDTLGSTWDPQSPGEAGLWGHTLVSASRGGAQPHRSISYKSLCSVMNYGGLLKAAGGCKICPAPSSAANTDAPGQHPRRQHPPWPGATVP